MSNAIQVMTGSRLHFGPLAVGAERGRSFGGVGLMVETPRLVLRARPSDRDRYRGPPELAGRVSEVIARLRVESPATPDAIAIDILEWPPAHCGFGSGTQLALAVAQAVLGEERIDAAALARWSGRGLRSAIGVHGFMRGGFLVDAGKQSSDALGELAVRSDFPADWRLLLWTREGAARFSGEREKAAFGRLPAMPARLTECLCALVLREMLPSVNSVDFEAFARALREYGDAVGAFFEPAQGGIFADEQAGDVVRWLAHEGLEGVAQTSWGPTLAVALPDQETAESLVGRWPFERGILRITRARNEPACIESPFPA
jgi:beta-RFAP synthase